VTSTSSRSLLGRGDLRGPLDHQSNTLRGERAHLSWFVSILQWEKRDWRRMGTRKNDCKGGIREGAGHYQEGHWDWVVSHMCCFLLALLF
jgi:hypothetical protein